MSPDLDPLLVPVVPEKQEGAIVLTQVPGRNVLAVAPIIGEAQVVLVEHA